MQLLRIDSSARQRSVSRQLTDAFAAAWKERNPGGTILSRDLASTLIPAISDEWVAGARSGPSQRSEAEQQSLAVSDELIEELEGSRAVVIGAPMYNFTISALLKAWIDQIVRPGKTVEYGPQGQRGLLGGRKVVVVTSRGGAYAENVRSTLDYQEPYLRAVLTFIGLTDVTFIHAENQLRRDQADTSRDLALTKIREFVQQTQWSN